MSKRHWIVAFAAALLMPIVVASPARLEPAPAKIASGKDVSETNVGPKVAGFTKLRRFPGSELRDGKAYPFVRSIPATATYHGIEVEGPHLLIEAASFDGPLDIYARQTLVLNAVTIRPAGKAPMALLVRPGAGKLYVFYSDTGGEAADIDAAVALRGDHAVLYRSRISGAADGIQMSGSGIRIEENLITTRRARTNDHNDAIQLLGNPKDVSIIGNRIINTNPQTSCITILGTKIAVRDNLISGGGWSLYGGKDNNGKGGGATDIEVTGNTFARDLYPKAGHFGPVAYWDTRNIWRDNRFDDGRDIPVK